MGPWIILERLTDVILANVPGCIVEIGAGRSTLVLAKHAEKMGVKFYTCDISTKGCNWIREQLPDCKNLEIYNGKSTNFMQEFNDKPSVVFIDGDHRAKIVKMEVDFFLEKLNVGGVMFLHDTCPWQTTYEAKIAQGRSIDTYTVRKELEKNPALDVFTWRYTAGDCGLTMVLKKDMMLPEYRT